jgi:hypothetical protein
MGSMTVEAKAKRVVHSSSGALADERDDRVEALEEGFDEGTPEEIEAAWMAEVKRRVADVKSGKAILISSETARQMRVEILERARARRTG